ncbi:hypothetical protein [Flexivirga caeni]|uniref:Uncharacterized protein n=1 Tax=Flexivirga caeni TaxID=2294115 RepID=A0A3M9M7V8_9MICO|nr:hypothetical protein [Flexivirga caeni]RNI21556.1 hypothetical protein EFY87_10320 [Flexivirga caeni]
MLDSKYVGVADLQQQATPFTALDIWQQFQGYRQQFAADSGKFRVLRSTDYGNQSRLDHTYWVAMLMFNFDTQGEALSWCQKQFHQTGMALQEYCIEAQYSAPTS